VVAHLSLYGFAVETRDQPLTVEDLRGIYTGYPFAMKAKSLQVLRDLINFSKVGWRTARLCAHATVIVRAIHVGFVGAEPRRAPADFEKFIKSRRTCSEFRLHRERIACIDAAQVFNRQRLVSGFDSANPYSDRCATTAAKHSFATAICGEAVVVADKGLALDFVAIAFAVFSKKRFGVAEFDHRAFATADDQFRISGCQVRLIEQQSALWCLQGW